MSSLKKAYKRRTLDEAIELAKREFKSQVANHFSSAEIDELRHHAALIGGSVHAGWETILGEIPANKDFYEIELYRRSAQCPYVEKIFVRMLVPRDRNSEVVLFLWRPPLPPWDGNYFE